MVTYSNAAKTDLLERVGPTLWPRIGAVVKNRSRRKNGARRAGRIISGLLAVSVTG